MTTLTEFGLDGMVIVVTGAGRGIGKAIALDVAAAGATVVACSRTSTELDTLAAEIAETGGKCATITADVSGRQGIDDLLDYTCRRFGRIDGMVNNAGVNILRDALDYSPDEVDLVIDLNFKAVYWSCVATARTMIEHDTSGSIVNITSQAGVVGAPGRAPYSGAKAAVNNITRSLAAEWAPYGIRVNALAPTVTLTPQLQTALKTRPDFADAAIKNIPLGRLAKPREMSLPTVFLLSHAASMMTGHILTVDGGWTSI